MLLESMVFSQRNPRRRVSKQKKKFHTKVFVTFIGLFSYLIVNISSQCTSVLVINLRRHKKSRKKCTERIKPCLLSKTKQLKKKKEKKIKKEVPARFELTISCLLDRRFNQLSHGTLDTLMSFFTQ